MKIDEFIDEEYEKYKRENVELLKDLKKSVQSMSKDLLTNLKSYYEVDNKFYSEDYEINNLSDIKDRYYSVIIEPIIYESKSYDIFCSAIWSSFINPCVVNPLVDSDEFYYAVEKFNFLQPYLFESILPTSQLLSDLKSFFYYNTISNEKRVRFEESNMITVFINKYVKEQNHIFIDFATALIKDTIDQNDIEEATIKQLFFDKLRDTFIDNINDRNINFNFAEQVYQDLYNDLEKERLLYIDYQTFRTFLVIDNSEYKVKELEKYIIISVENNNMNLKDVGHIFYDLSKKFKGNTKSFIKWIQLNFKWIKRDGTEASMTLNSLTKLIKPR
jgi:hypothetical protein